MPDVVPPQPAATTPAAAEDPLSRPAAAVVSASLNSKDPQIHRFGVWLRQLLVMRPRKEDHLREAIEELISNSHDEPATTQSAVATHERKLISNVLELRDLSVLDIMVPRANIVAVSVATPVEELLRMMAERPHSRLPVYKGDLDNIVGVLNMKDIFVKLATQGDISIENLMREPMVVSPAMRVMDLILHMRQSKVHMAFVVDEFGGIDGLVTINDLIEAIVGEIDDEYDFEVTPQLIERPDGSAIADARYPIEAFEERFGNVFTEDEEREEVDTLGGLVTYLAGRVPMRGEVIRHENGMEFDIIDADPRRVTRLRVRNLPPKAADSAPAEG
jgi:CBS domain containing-hemolysin-like protein